MAEITVRRASSADAMLLAQLGARLFEQTFGAANTVEDMQTYVRGAFTVEAQRPILEQLDRVAFLAEDGGRGAIGYATAKRGSRADGVTGSRPVEIQRLYADHTWHGRGVGAALMRACIDQAISWRCDELWLCVWEKNPRAIAFYEKSGFRIVGRQLFQLGNDVQHDFVMARDVGAADDAPIEPAS